MLFLYWNIGAIGRNALPGCLALERFDWIRLAHHCHTVENKNKIQLNERDMVHISRCIANVHYQILGLRMGSTIFSKNWEPPTNSRRKKGDTSKFHTEDPDL